MAYSAYCLSVVLGADVAFTSSSGRSALSNVKVTFEWILWKNVIRAKFLLLKVLDKGSFTVSAFEGGSGGQLFHWSSIHL
jgi:hypothetical protein